MGASESEDSDVPNALAKKVAQEDDEIKDQSKNLIKKIKQQKKESGGEIQTSLKKGVLGMYSMHKA